MTTETAPAKQAIPSSVEEWARDLGTDARELANTVMLTLMPPGASVVDLAALAIVAKRYGLSPFTREIYAFPKKGGGIQPIVSIDGWIKLANDHPQCDGWTFEDRLDGDGGLVSITCKVHRKDRSHPVESTEYMVECKRNTDPWKNWPRRMLRHKALIQALRQAFGFAGIADPDEGERIEMSAAEEVREARVVDAGQSRSSQIADALSGPSAQGADFDPAAAEVAEARDSDWPTDEEMAAVHSGEMFGTSGGDPEAAG